MAAVAEAPLEDTIAPKDVKASTCRSWDGASSKGSTYLKALSHVRSVPSVSFHGKLPSTFAVPHQSPAPGSYQPPDAERISRHRTAPRFGFGRRVPLQDSARAPGPGAYEPRPQRGFKGNSFGSAPSRGAWCDVRELTAKPGPGAYHKSDSGTLAVGRGAPGFKMQGRFREEKPRGRSVPGPGAYDTPAASNFKHEGTTKYPSSKMAGFGTSLREDLHAKHVTCGPGPGAYDPETWGALGNDSVKFSMTSRRMTHDADGCLAPGPGEYGTGGTSFGYSSSFSRSRTDV